MNSRREYNMALKYGTNFLASDIARGLEKNEKQREGTRTWSQLFGGASLGFGAQSDALTTDYASAMREAYTANFNRQNTIMGGGLNQGYTEQAAGLNRQDLAKTYDKFVTNYSKDIQSAAQNYGSEVSTISGDLTQRADNFSKLFSSAYDYLSNELSGSYITDQTDFSDPIYEFDEKGKVTDNVLGYNQKQLDYLEEKGLDWLYAGEGEERRLMNWEEASALLFDGDGELTEEGVRFYDQTLNARPDGYMRDDETGTRSFDQWLSDTDTDLRDWWQSADDFNYNFAGTNRGSANIMTGRESTDFKEDMPETTLLNAQKSGIDEIVNKIRGLDNITSLNTEVVKDKFFKGKNFDEILKATDDILTGDNWKKIDNTTSLRYSEALEDYGDEYKKRISNQISTFKSELSSMLGSSVSGEFWHKYGAEIDKLYREIANINIGKTGSHINRLTALRDYTKKLQSYDLDKAISNLQENLKQYINQKRTETKKMSGF